MQSPNQPGMPGSSSNPNQPYNAGPGVNPGGPPPYPNQPPPYPNQPPPYQGYPQPGMVPVKKRSNRTLFIILGVVAVIVIILGVIVATVPAGPAAISKAVMAKDFQNKATVNETTVFATSDPKVFCVVNLDNPKPTTVVKAIWYVVSAGTIQNQKITEGDFTTTGGENIVALSLVATGTFPAGSYKVEVYLDGTLNRTLEFSVQ